ncbi:uncharacterized protein PGTG_10855 [Puccinia graminis f. sp. tritici CRL 75-36-700-3]|uniref:CxC1-like cysteine cluster associated with KDZ transposases domain-containing protein n=1 Tax=Puccinia graminis f. sp. tritici (strain CRL 75-36-700-3 / race SCCL) TaxID=418459 RepID=E3KK71_PUCGT|nr:uncharacterized protein PGTG_10855 [Puccinia graminis f. sp. tritici CRL 75-36-700-3]EFP84696.2 hypothetical protein PGTG_10855 [Puccinia graminis f. sp. tritici CRL 75-36-700-3]
MTIKRIVVCGTDRTQQVRRRIYAGRIASNLSRLHSAENADRQRAQRPMSEPNENVMDHPTGSFHVFQDNEQEDREDINEDEHEDKTEQAPVWVDLIEEQPDDIDDLIAANKERHRQQARDFNWAVLINYLLPVYMRLRIVTKNWSSTNSYDTFSSCLTTCSKKYNRLVDLQRKQVTFCECTMDGVRLLQQGYLAGSPVKPQTAFSLPLLIFHNSLWNHCHIGAQPFTLALNDWLEPRSQRLCARKGKHPRQLRKPFSAAVDMFRQLEEKRKKSIFSVLGLSNQEFVLMATSSTVTKSKLVAITKNYAHLNFSSARRMSILSHKKFETKKLKE